MAANEFHFRYEISIVCCMLLYVENGFKCTQWIYFCAICITYYHACVDLCSTQIVQIRVLAFFYRQTVITQSVNQWDISDIFGMEVVIFTFTFHICFHPCYITPSCTFCAGIFARPYGKHNENDRKCVVSLYWIASICVSPSHNCNWQCFWVFTRLLACTGNTFTSRQNLNINFWKFFRLTHPISVLRKYLYDDIPEWGSDWPV